MGKASGVMSEVRTEGDSPLKNEDISPLEFPGIRK
jgi:hypothetical protein